MNAFNNDLFQDLIDLMNDTARDERVAALVITGTGKFCSSGADLKNSQLLFQQPPNEHQTHLAPPRRFMLTLLEYPKIIAAAVNGPAVGIACIMLLHFYLVHCRPNATFWAPLTRLALVPELCSSVTFRETMGSLQSH